MEYEDDSTTQGYVYNELVSIREGYLLKIGDEDDWPPFFQLALTN